MNGSQSPTSMHALLVEAARIHWAHILTLVATTIIYAPGVLAAGNVLAGLVQESPAGTNGQATAELTVDPLTLLAGLAVILLLSSGAFVLWLRIAALGLAEAIGQPIGAWVGQILRTAMVLVGAGLIVLVPLSFLAALIAAATGASSGGANVLLLVLASVGANAAIALLFIPLAEAATGRWQKTSAHVKTRASRVRVQLVPTLVVATFGLALAGAIIIELLSAIGAPLSALMAQSLVLTVSTTYIAAILGAVYRNIGGTLGGAGAQG